MSYIIPNSTIYLYNNIELDNSYRDTFYFTGIQAQNDYFTVTKPYKYAFLAQSYQRTGKGTLRIEKNAEFLFDCNYLRFNNPRTDNGITIGKWYYAFITGCEYINENVSEISYEIDIMQTYFFDVIIEPSFVVRQHVLSDNLYEHIIEEELNIGSDYVVASEGNSFPLEPESVLVFSTRAGDGGDLPLGSIINGVATSLAVASFTGNSLNDAMLLYKDWLSNSSFTGPTTLAESIIATYLVPSILCTGATNLIPPDADKSIQYVIGTPDNVGGGIIPTPFPIYSHSLSFDGYSPHNYKLFTYPYNFLVLSNHMGDIIDYKYELFGHRPNEPVEFMVAGIVLPNPAFMCYPIMYRGVAEDLDSGMTISDFPTVPVTINGYEQYMNRNSAKMTASALSAAIGLGTGLASAGMTPIMGSALMRNWGGEITGDAAVKPWASALSYNRELGSAPNSSAFVRGVLGQRSEWHAGQRLLGTLSNSFSNIASIIGTNADAQKLPNGAKGSPTGNGLLIGLGRYEFQQYHMQIRRQQAEKIDTFFDMFGYSMNRVMNVNRNGRPVYNYVKTQDCSIIPVIGSTGVSGADSATLKALRDIYDNGITFWNPDSGYNVGDYSYACRNANSLHPVNANSLHPVNNP